LFPVGIVWPAPHDAPCATCPSSDVGCFGWNRRASRPLDPLRASCAVVPPARALLRPASRASGLPRRRLGEAGSLPPVRCSLRRSTFPLLPSGTLRRWRIVSCPRPHQGNRRRLRYYPPPSVAFMWPPRFSCPRDSVPRSRMDHTPAGPRPPTSSRHRLAVRSKRSAGCVRVRTPAHPPSVLARKRSPLPGSTSGPPSGHTCRAPFPPPPPFRPCHRLRTLAATPQLR